MVFLLTGSGFLSLLGGERGRRAERPPSVRARPSAPARRRDKATKRSNTHTHSHTQAVITGEVGLDQTLRSAGLRAGLLVDTGGPSQAVPLMRATPADLRPSGGAERRLHQADWEEAGLTFDPQVLDLDLTSQQLSSCCGFGSLAQTFRWIPADFNHLHEPAGKAQVTSGSSGSAD